MEMVSGVGGQCISDVPELDSAGWREGLRCSPGGQRPFIITLWDSGQNVLELLESNLGLYRHKVKVLILIGYGLGNYGVGCNFSWTLKRFPSF